MQQLRSARIASIGAVLSLLVVLSFFYGKSTSYRFSAPQRAQPCVTDCLGVFVQKIQKDVRAPLRAAIVSGTIKLDELDTAKLTSELDALITSIDQGLINSLSTKENSKLVFNLRRRVQGDVTTDTLYVIIPRIKAKYCQSTSGGPMPREHKVAADFYVEKDNSSIVADAFPNKWNGSDACITMPKTGTYLFWPIIGRAKSSATKIWELQ